MLSHKATILNPSTSLLGPLDPWGRRSCVEPKYVPGRANCLEVGLRVHSMAANHQLNVSMHKHVEFLLEIMEGAKDHDSS